MSGIGHQVALKRHHERYLWERSANHVKTEWERARKEEAEAAQRDYEEWLRQAVRMANLLAVLLASYIHTSSPQGERLSRETYSLRNHARDWRRRDRGGKSSPVSLTPGQCLGVINIRM